jgi:hypothetical protein
VDENDKKFIERAFGVDKIDPAILDHARELVDAVRAVEPTIQDSVLMARAAELAMRPGPRRPLSVELEELRKGDLRRLQGR